MARRKRACDLLQRVNVSFTVAQLNRLDTLDAPTRAEAVRGIVQKWFEQEDARARASKEGGNSKLGSATDTDIERTFDAHADLLLVELLESFNDGRQVSYLVPAFTKFLREDLGKTAHEDQILWFLREKMMLVGESQ
ncbi:MAG: hypothetical protein WC262_13330 [Bacteroidales bacterium]|jgi:hypothetical protein